MMLLVTVCARAGSRRLPGKHMREFAEMPLIYWTVFQADKILEFLGADCRVCISTDDEQITNMVYAEFGMPTVRQPDWCAKNDDNPKINAVRDALQQSERDWGMMFDAVLDLDATAPLRPQEYVFRALELFESKLPPVLFSVTEARRSPYFNQAVMTQWGSPMLPCGSNGIRNRPHVYDLNAAIYIYRRNWLLDERNIHPVVPGALPFQMPAWTSIDIDKQWEFYAAEELFRRYM